MLEKSQRNITVRVTGRPTEQCPSKKPCTSYQEYFPSNRQETTEQYYRAKIKKQGRNSKETAVATRRGPQAKWQNAEKGQWTKNRVPDIHNWLNRKHRGGGGLTTKLPTGHLQLFE